MYWLQVDFTEFIGLFKFFPFISIVIGILPKLVQLWHDFTYDRVEGS